MLPRFAEKERVASTPTMSDIVVDAEVYEAIGCDPVKTGESPVDHPTFY